MKLSNFFWHASAEWVEAWRQRGASIVLGRSDCDLCREWTEARLKHNAPLRARGYGSRLNRDRPEGEHYRYFVGFCGEFAASRLLQAPIRCINERAFDLETATFLGKKWGEPDVLDYDVKVSGSKKVIEAGLFAVRPENLTKKDRATGRVIAQKPLDRKILGGFVKMNGLTTKATEVEVILVGVVTVGQLKRDENLTRRLGSGETYAISWKESKAFRPMLAERLKEIAK